jgi:hypothetical protein
LTFTCKHTRRNLFWRYRDKLGNESEREKEKERDRDKEREGEGERPIDVK